MSRLQRSLDRGVGAVLAALMALAVANVSWQVVSRFVLGDPSAFTDELARTLLIWIGLLGAAHAAGRRLHVAVDLLPARLEPVLGRGLRIAAQTLVALFAAAVLGAGGLGLVSLSLELGQTSAALGLSLGVVYAAVPLSGLLILLHGALALAEELRRP